MPRPWSVVERAHTSEGALELRQRGESDFMILVAGRVLMTSMIHLSELAVAQLACEAMATRQAPRVLIGGLGLGYTLRAALDALPANASVTVVELTQEVVDWCRGPVSHLSEEALSDPRVTVEVGDVTDAIRRAVGGTKVRYDAIILDLYMGPVDLPKGRFDPLYGPAILADTYKVLRAGGVLSVWAEEPNRAYVARLKRAGFHAELKRVKGGGPRHSVYLATRRR